MFDFTISAVYPVPASGPGALDGFEFRCSCGTVLSSSLRGMTERDQAAHAAWHARKGESVSVDDGWRCATCGDDREHCPAV